MIRKAAALEIGGGRQRTWSRWPVWHKIRAVGGWIWGRPAAFDILIGSGRGEQEQNHLRGRLWLVSSRDEQEQSYGKQFLYLNVKQTNLKKSHYTSLNTVI